MVYVPLAVSGGTVNVWEPELGIPAVDKLVRTGDKRHRTGCRSTHKRAQSLCSSGPQGHCVVSMSRCQMSWESR